MAETHQDWYGPAEEDCDPDIANQNEVDFGKGGAFVPPELSRDIIGAIYDAGCVEGFAKHYPMSRLELIIRSIEDSVEGYWVGSRCRKEKDTMEFGAVELRARKLAVIVPFEDQLLEDADTDIVALVKGDVVRKFVEKIDKTFMGYEPSSPFADSLSGNVPLGHIIVAGADPDNKDLAGDLSAAVSEVEKDGFDVTGMIAHKGVKHLLRNLRDLNNNPIYTESLGDCAPRDRYCVWGIPICFTNQADAQSSPLGYEILMADFNYVLVGDRTGLQVTFSKDATLTQSSMDDINLFEDDMTAGRYVIRKAFTIARDNALAKVTGVV